MNITDFASQEEVQRACKKLGIRDWTKLTDTKVQPMKAHTGSRSLRLSKA